MIKVSVRCPHCRNSLMDDGNRIDGEPTIGLVIVGQKTFGWLRLSSLYGSYAIESEFPAVDGEIGSFYCPWCHGNLRGSRLCDDCGAPMIPLEFTDGGVVQLCSRRGCKRHLVEFEEIEREMSAFYAHYSTFFKGK